MHIQNETNPNLIIQSYPLYINPKEFQAYADIGED